MEVSIEDYVKCCQCKEIAKEPVEGQCCGSIYCESCYDGLSKMRKRCALCKLNGFQVQPSMLARRIIGKFQAKCQYGCPSKITYAQKQQHQVICLFRTIICKKCKKQITIRDLVHHMKELHPKQLSLIMIEHNVGLSESQKNSAVSKVGKKPAKHCQIEVMNSNGDIARFGQSGKYYCGKKNLIGRCVCCDGHCGADDGENCDACMALDCERLNLPRGYLVNTQGIICKKGDLKNLYICGRKVKGTFCNEEKQCKDCFRVSLSVDKLGRYKNLI